MDDIQCKIERDILRLEEISDESLSVKKNLIRKLSSVVGKVDIDPNIEKPKVLEAKLKVFDTLSNILNSYEKEYRDTIKLKMKKESDDNIADNVSTIIGEIFNQLSSVDFIKKKVLKVSDDVDGEIEHTIEKEKSIPNPEEITISDDSTKLVEEILGEEFEE